MSVWMIDRLLRIQSMNNSNTKSSLAVPFITFQEGVGFTLSKEAQEFLLDLPSEKSLGIISIVGKYRTGKSFFVNRVLLDQKKGGFQVGPTVNPCTKGLWLWKKTIPSLTNQNMHIIVIDTQGFGGMDENLNHDSRIFLFSLLLSSYFIYNSVGSIDENALNNLNTVINLAKDIQTKSSGKQQQDLHSFPAFLWIVRDFSLMLQDKSGNKISSKQYLQNALELQKGSSDAIESKNKIRRHLKHFFQDRECELMVRPIENEKDLQRLDEMNNSSLRPEFITQVEAIRNKIYSKVKAKKIGGKTLNGQLLVALCKGYMEAINKGALPNVESAWFYVCRSEGLKAVKEATDFMQHEIRELIKSPIKESQISDIKNQLRTRTLDRFKKRSMNSQQTHPDLLQKLQKRLEQSFGGLVKKNKNIWDERYRQQTQKITQIVKDRIYNDQYEQFSDFVKDFQEIKSRYDELTADGDAIQKWKYFNEISEHLYRLAGETITTKINKNLHQEKIAMQHKLQKQEEQLQYQQKMLEDEKDNLKTKIEALERENGKIALMEESHKARALQYKSQHDKIYQKYRQLYNDHEQLSIQFQKLKKQSKRIAQSQIEDTKNQLTSIQSTLQRERSLHQMEKKFMEQQLERCKERSATLQNQCRKLRTSNSKMSSDLQEMQNKYQEKKQQLQILQQTNTTFSKKIQNLMTQNSKKSELMSDHSQWLLQKSYLQNQLSFLKNTMNENKKLHDSLLVALQQSLSTSQSENHHELIEANKNLSSALQKMEGRCKILEQKYDRVKEFKKIMKNCQTMQCIGCSKWLPTLQFASHIEQCCGSSVTSLREKLNPDVNRENLHISVSQTISKQSQQKKKSYTEYIIQISLGQQKWKVHKRYRQFTDLQQMLIKKYPSIRYPPSCNFLVDINNLVASKQKNMMSEERRKSLQQYLRDLVKIEDIKASDILRKFLELPQGTNQFRQTKMFKQTSQKKEKMYL